MIIDLNKKTVQELRQCCRELLDEGILDATRTEISKAKKAELIEWIAVSYTHLTLPTTPYV